MSIDFVFCLLLSLSWAWGIKTIRQHIRHTAADYYHLVRRGFHPADYPVYADCPPHGLTASFAIDAYPTDPSIPPPVITGPPPSEETQRPTDEEIRRAQLNAYQRRLDHSKKNFLNDLFALMTHVLMVGYFTYHLILLIQHNWQNYGY